MPRRYRCDSGHTTHDTLGLSPRPAPRRHYPPRGLHAQLVRHYRLCNGSLTALLRLQPGRPVRAHVRRRGRGGGRGRGAAAGAAAAAAAELSSPRARAQPALRRQCELSAAASSEGPCRRLPLSLFIYPCKPNQAHNVGLAYVYILYKIRAPDQPLGPEQCSLPGVVTSSFTSCPTRCAPSHYLGPLH